MLRANKAIEQKRKEKGIALSKWQKYIKNKEKLLNISTLILDAYKRETRVKSKSQKHSLYTLM